MSAALLIEVFAWALLASALWSVVLGYSAGPLHLRSLLSTDELYLPALYRDLFREGGHLSLWRLTPAPYFFPDWPLYFASNALLGDFRRAVLGYGAAQVLLFVWALRALGRAALPFAGPELRIRAVAVVAASALLYGTGHFRFLDPLVMSAEHAGCFLLCLASWALTARILRGRAGRGVQITLAALCLLGALSDGLFVVTFTLPAAITLGLLAWRARYPRQVLASAGAVLGVSSVAGYALARLVTHGHAAAGYGTLRWASALGSLKQLGLTAIAFASGPSACVALLACLASGWIAWRAVGVLREPRGPVAPEDGRGALALFVLIATGTNCAAVVVTGTFVDGGCMRYLLLPLLAPLWVAAIAIPIPPRIRGVLTFGVLAVLGTLAARFFATHRLSTPAPWAWIPEKVACLDAHRAQEGLERGLSDYWNAKLVSLFSETGLRAVQVSARGDPEPWVSSRAWYLGRTPRASAYTFVLPERLDAAALRQRFGPPQRTFTCGGSAVWVYGHGTFDTAVRAQFAASSSSANASFLR